MRKGLLLLFVLAFNNSYGQSNMADTMRSNGKIYVVVSVLCIVFAVITFYLISIDRKVTRLEKKNK